MEGIDIVDCHNRVVNTYVPVLYFNFRFKFEHLLPRTIMAIDLSVAQVICTASFRLVDIKLNVLG